MFDAKYEEIFEPIRDEEEIYVKDQISKVDPKNMRIALRSMLDKINSLPLSVPQWTRFKMDMLAEEKKLGQPVFVWSARTKQAARAYVSIDVNWDILKTAKDYFVVWMTIEANNVLPDFEGYKTPYDFFPRWKCEESDEQSPAWMN